MLSTRSRHLLGFSLFGHSLEKREVHCQFYVTNNEELRRCNHRCVFQASKEYAKNMQGTKKVVFVHTDEFVWIPAYLISQNQRLAKVSVPQYESKGDLLVHASGERATWFKTHVVELKTCTNRTLPLADTTSDGNLNVVDDIDNLLYSHEVRPSPVADKNFQPY